MSWTIEIYDAWNLEPNADTSQMTPTKIIDAGGDIGVMKGHIKNYTEFYKLTRHRTIEETPTRMVVHIDGGMSTLSTLIVAKKQ
jgi:hypothetical protein